MKTYDFNEIFDDDYNVIHSPKEAEYKIRNEEELATEWHLRAIGKDGKPDTQYHTQTHRIGGPAVEYDDGSEQWYEYGELHRVGGPAVIDVRGEGEICWAYRGQYVTNYEDYQHLTGCSDEDIVMFKLKYGMIE